MTTTDTTIPELICVGCSKRPADIPEYVSMAALEGLSSADDFVRQEEGTLNASNGHFWCTDCYIAAGMPLGVAS